MVLFLNSSTCTMKRIRGSENKICMKPSTLALLPPQLSESTLTAYSSKTQRQKPGIVKLMPPPVPPDEKTIRELNALASKHPFCRLHSVKRHDTL
jgi:hypothetical protein